VRPVFRTQQSASRSHPPPPLLHNQYKPLTSTSTNNHTKSIMGALDKIASSTSRTPATNKRKQKNSALPYTPTITALPEINITNVQKAVKALIAYTLKKEKEEETIQVTIAVKKVSGRKVVGAKRM